MAQWFGDISYSLYLVHFPVLIFAFSIFGDGLWVASACVPVMVGLAWLCRVFVEQPVIDGRFLAGIAKLKNHRRFVARDAAVGVAVLASIVVLSVAQLRGPEVLRSGASAAEALGMTRLTTTDVAPTTPAQRDTAVSTAAAASSWPSPVRAELSDLFSFQQTPAMGDDGCLNNVLQRSVPRVCGPDESHVDVMVVGDSVTVSWLPAVQYYADQHGWTVMTVGFGNCPLYDVAVTNRTGSDAFVRACADRRQQMLAMIADHSPSLVVLSASETAIGYTGLPLDEAGVAWRNGVERTLRSLAAVPRVALLSNPPLTPDPVACASRLSSPASCLGRISEDYRIKSLAEADAAATVPNAVAVDTRGWFCTADECPAFVGDTVLKTDTSHLTEAAAREVGPLLAESLDVRPQP